MTATVNALTVRRVLGRKEWGPPHQFGPDGWLFQSQTPEAGRCSVIVSADRHDDGLVWIHASISRELLMPSYDDLQLLHRAVFGDGYAYQVFAPPTSHVNIHEHALHLWGRADGRPELPEFGRFGTI